MRRCWFVIMILFLSYNSEAQGIFNQKAGQIKNLIKQIALLQVYIGYLEKGYDIAKTGLATISDLKSGDLHLHIDNFNSLKNVNPKIKTYAKLADIVNLQLQMLKEYKTATDRVKGNSFFNSAEIEYVYTVFTHLLGQCGVVIDELILLTSSGQYEMKDNERLQRIDVLESDMRDKYSFARDFGTDVQLLYKQKQKEKNEVGSSRLIYNIKTP